MTPAKIATLALCLASLTASLGSDGAAPEARQGEWLPIPAQSLEIAAGSALDLSSLVPGEAGARGALRLDGKGQLALGDSGDPRFNCGMIANGPDMTWAMPDHAAADALALQFRRHGYNLVRFHFMDARLMQGAKADYAFNPENIDRFHYLLAGLKRNGVYWMLDMLTSPDGGRRQNFKVDTRSVNNVKDRLNFDPAAQAEWLRMVDAIYAQRNPYTGQSTLSDPALAFVVGANENSIAFWSQITKNGPYPAGLADKFNQWLRSEFPKREALSAALPGLSEAELAGRTPIAPPADWNASGPRMNLFLRFVSSLEVQSYRWMQGKLRERGYQGPVLGFHEWYKQQNNRTRAALPITDIHAYIGEVSSEAPGSPLRLPASLATEGLGPLTSNLAARWLDRPMVVSEYGTPFPNPYRRDSGLMFPAIAAFQGFSAICRMANLSVEPAIGGTGRGIFPYRIGVDPMSRVAETLATLLFYRRDVAPADKGVVAIPFGEREKDRIGSAFMPFEIRRAALVARFGLIDPEKVAAIAEPKTVIPLPPAPYSASEKAMDRVVDMVTGRVEEKQRRLFDALKANGILPADNRTDPDKGIYQNQTGQLTLDERGGTYRIVTPRTEAVTSKAPATNLTLGTLSVLSLDEGALVAASALDGKPLAQSDKILLMLAGDASNTALALSGNGLNRTVIDWGTAPVLLQRVRASIRLRSSRAFNGRFSILALNGAVTQSRPATSTADGTIALTLDTAGARNMPTTYFLLEKTVQP